MLRSFKASLANIQVINTKFNMVNKLKKKDLFLLDETLSFLELLDEVSKNLQSVSLTFIELQHICLYVKKSLMEDHYNISKLILNEFNNQISNREISC